MPEKNFCGFFFMSNEHFCSCCPNMYVFSHGDAPRFLSPHSPRLVLGDFLPYLCDVLEYGWCHVSLSLPRCVSRRLSSPGRRCSMDMVAQDLQAQGPGDGVALAGEDLQAQGLGDGLLDI